MLNISLAIVNDYYAAVIRKNIYRVKGYLGIITYQIAVILKSIMQLGHPPSVSKG